MKQLFIISCIMLFALLPIIPTTSIHAQNTADAPYIYYYSNVLNSFVIERADGTDSHLFGADHIPADKESISGYGWSPSGEWFAWRTGHGEARNFRHRPTVLNVRENRELSGLDDFITAQITWSPNADLLLVTGYVGEPQIDEENALVTVTLRTRVIDAATDTILFTHDVTGYAIASTDDHSNRPEFPFFPDAYWTPDGQHVMLEYALLTFGVNGTIAAGGIEYVIEAFDQTGDSAQFNLLEAEMIREAGHNDYGISNGKIASSPVTDPTTLLIHDRITNQTTEIDTGNLIINTVAFSPTAESALMLGQNADCVDDCPYSILHWIEGTSQLALVYDDGDWTNFRDAFTWSPDGNFAVILTLNFVPLLVDGATGAVSTIKDVPNAVYWRWDGPSSLVLATTTDTGTAYRVDLATNTLEHTVSRPHPYERYDIGQFSPDGSLFAYVEENPVIVDLSTNTETDIRPDGRSNFSLDGGEVYWSADSEWILLAEEALIAGGGAPRWTSIVKRDGSMRRELGQNGSPTTVGWLPDNVDVAQLSALQTSPLFPTPTATIHTPDWSFALSWSPDGTQIARGAVNLGGVLGPSTLHDVTTGDHLADLDPMNFEFNRVAWTQNDDGSYSPQIIEQPVPSGNFGSVIFATSPDGSLSAEYGTDEGDEIAIYDVATGEMLHSEYRLGMAAVSFTPDNSLVVISSPYARAILYDGNTWEPILTFNTHATAVAFSPDSQTLALANSWDIDLYAVDELLPSTD